MGILFSDGFDSYAATSDLTKQWQTAQSPWVFNATGGRNGGGCIQAATTGGGIIKPVSAGFSANSLVCFAFWLKASAAPVALGVLINTKDTAGAAKGTLRVTTAGKLALYSSAGSILEATGSVNVCDGNWHWIEWYLQESSAATTNKLYVDSLVEWNGLLTTSNIANSVDSFELTSITGITITLDDFIAWDASSGNPQPSDLPLGPRQITTVRPQADSSVAFATATGGGTHFNQVNEVNADGDATYVESASSGDADLYDFAAMGVAPATITAVVAKAYVENPNPGVINFRQNAKSGSTTTNGATVQAPSSYKTLQQPFPLDPNTGLAWASASAVDAATIGVGIP